MASQFFQSTITAYSGLSDATRLGDLEGLKLSSRVVMRVWTDHPQYLRARAYSHFDGRGWTTRPETYSSIPTLALDTVPDGQLRDWLAKVPGSTFAIAGQESCASSNPCVHTRIIQNLFNEGMMVSPGNKLLIRAALPNLRADSQENLRPLVVGGVETYAVLNRHVGDLVQPVSASPEELREALELPANTDPRIYEIAARLAEGASAPEEKLRRTVDYLQQQYHYTLEVGDFHTSQPVAEFLFEKKKGYCQYFASAAAVLLRQEGVPTRYVSGFHVTENNLTGDHYVIREMDTHAWIESYIAGRGWAQADPTPVSEYQSLHASLSRSWFSDAWEWMQAQTAQILVHMREEDWRTRLRRFWERTRPSLPRLSFICIGVTIAVIFLALLVCHARREKLARQSPLSEKPQIEHIETAPSLALLLRSLDLYWTECGVSRPDHRAPLEHLESIPAEKFPPGILRASRRLIETYYLASFGGNTLSPEELRTLQREFECIRSSSSTSAKSRVHD